MTGGKKLFFVYLAFLFFLLTATTNISATNVAVNYYPFIGATILIYLVIFCIWFAVAYWAYKDAERRGLNGVLWGIVVFFGGIIGIIIYLVLRDEQKPKKPDRICPNCGRAIPIDASICPYCAKRFEVRY